jgi:hypothetical protein
MLGEPWKVLEVVFRCFQLRGKGIGAGDFCVGQNMDLVASGTSFHSSWGLRF